MAQVKITPDFLGPKIELNGQPMTQVRHLSLDFPCDGLATVRMESFLEKPFEFDESIGDVRIDFILPEGCTLIDVTTMNDKGRHMRVVRTER